MSTRRGLRAPFPWYGGKSLAAELVWRAFGHVPNYVEPFAGSLAVLLARPGGAGKVETANDKDGLIANFWRATRDKPDDVVRWADWPVNEADLHARHRWLVAQVPELLEKLIADPEYSDAKIAGWWVWGVCIWIGRGWCTSKRAEKANRPQLNNANAHGLVNVQRQIPAVTTPSRGLNAPTSRSATAWMRDLADRLARVRICCGDWTRVLGRSTLGIETNHGMSPCGVLLDPPYDHDVRHDRDIYAEDTRGVARATRAWAIENGDNPALRIALCGLEGEHAMPVGWTKIAWANTTTTSKARAKERIWFSPHCLPVDVQRGLFAEAS